LIDRTYVLLLDLDIYIVREKRNDIFTCLIYLFLLEVDVAESKVNVSPLNGDVFWTRNQDNRTGSPFGLHFNAGAFSVGEIKSL
jgi:hypothetical protein